MTKAQQKVVDLMREGWELCGAHRIRGEHHYWLQKNGAGCGGPVQPVRGNVVHNMFQDGIIVVAVAGFPTTTYKLGPFAGDKKP